MYIDNFLEFNVSPPKEHTLLQPDKEDLSRRDVLMVVWESEVYVYICEIFKRVLSGVLPRIRNVETGDPFEPVWWTEGRWVS